MLTGKKFDIEHALSMYATSYAQIPAWGIYEKDILADMMPVIGRCHIYIIGTMPRIEITKVGLENNKLVTEVRVAGENHQLAWPVPAGAELVETEHGTVVKKGEQCWAPTEEQVARRLNNQLNVLPFDVLYIGQAYGKDGSRSALDRLLKHETLQKISVKGVAANQLLTLLMLEVVPANRLITVMNPWAEDKSESKKRISAGLDKLFETTEAERITLFEASLIRYFQPPFNREFKDSFPSTNLKILADCYEKDFSAIVSEVKIDELPFKLSSGVVPPAQYHTAMFDLHDDDARKVFFSGG